MASDAAAEGATRGNSQGCAVTDSTPATAALNLLHRAGRCHNAYCDEPTSLVVRVRRANGRWTTGIDYCEQHAHEAAQRMRETFKVVVEPT